MAKNGEIKGLDKLLKDLSNLGEEGKTAIREVTIVNAQEIAANAKIAARVGDTGKLQQSITVVEIDKLTQKVLVNSTGLAPYAAYVEFGTGGLVEVPDELKDQAIKFIGKGIREVNLHARPYLYPSFVKGRKQYVADLEDELNTLTKKI